METVTALNAKRLSKTVAPADLESLANSIITLVNNGELDAAWTIEHCLREVNKRFFYSYGTLLYSDSICFTPLLTNLTAGGTNSYLLLENGSYLLLESGDKIIIS